MKLKKVTLKSGQTRWECVADGPRNPATGKRNQITRRGKTQKEAKNKVLQEIRSLEETQVDKKYTRKMTFDEVATKWLEVYELTGKKKNTMRIRKQEVSVLNEQIAKMPIEKITHAVYQEVIRVISKDRARTTVQGINTTGNMIFKYAKRNNLIKDNPATDVVIPKERKTVEQIKESNIEEKYLEHDELEKFLAAVLDYGLRYDKERFYTLAFSGMRSGELCALQKSDLNFEDNIISITKTLYNEKNNMKEYELTPPKTDGSIRDIEMEQPIMDMLKKVVRENDEHKMQYRTLIEDFHDKDFVFSRGNGYPFVTKTILIRMNRILDKTSIKKHATPHIFRHTYISMAAEAKIDIATVMKKVGHEDIETTMRIYTHVTNKMKKDASEQISNLYGNILEKINF
ncbi:site-specific integrase [Virgibacillus sp. M23]|uniref:tyrosine-type recombinase/integrase n=1 Tax=Virgibacillus sp. M23 TaxID=3079030 RepID=UPI002A91813E|nr:site-specific integrase [Virgibacillus sp. M23]MDY7044386.1 site-specific integrase [Virgibacillus sp. M23]